MKASLAMAFAAPLFVAADGPGRGGSGSREMDGHGGPGRGGGGPGGGRFGCAHDDDCVYTGCASSCFSSFWESATPSPTAFCNGDSGIHTCIESACTSEDDLFTSYSSRRSSLCSEYQSCESTGTYTYTYSTPPPGEGPWGGGRFSDRPFPTGEVVYTGCPWNGDGWGFPFWGGYGGGPGFWDDDGGHPGWSYTTVTTTMEETAASSTLTATAVIEQAASGDATTFRTLGLDETSETATPNAAPTGSNVGVKMAGAALGAVVAVAGML